MLGAVSLRRLIAWLGTRYPWIERLVESHERELYRHARMDRRQLRKALITESDLLEAVRQQTGGEGLEGVKALILERSGEISVIRRLTTQSVGAAQGARPKVSRSLVFAVCSVLRRSFGKFRPARLI